MKPIFIIGFPGVGKSTVGRTLARLLSLRFLDTDDLLAARYHSSVSSMIEGCGIDKFRKRERALLIGLLREQDCVIATGGGLPVYDDNMSLMLEHGHVLHLDSDTDVLADRLYQERASRPAVADLSRDGVAAYIDDLKPRRDLVYQQAHATIDATRLRDEADSEAIAVVCRSILMERIGGAMQLSS